MAKEMDNAGKAQIRDLALKRRSFDAVTRNQQTRIAMRVDDFR